MIIKNKISFCTVCMNRVHHLKQTLPKNIKDNMAYGNIEFVVLNYNSKDDIDEWIENEMSEYISSGLLSYYKTTEPEVFQMSHSKNVVARCATGDIICNIDADNYTGQGFADFVNQCFIENNNIFLTTDMTDSIRDCCGRICVKHKDFNKIRGYDENMKSYGFEDEDLKNRLQIISVEQKNIQDKSYLTAISHNDEERLMSDTSFLEIEKVCVRQKSYSSFIILFLFKNSKYFIGEVLKNRLINSESIENLFLDKRLYDYEFSLLDDDWETGKWSDINNIKLDNSPQKILTIRDKDINEKDASYAYIKVNEIEFIQMTEEDDILNSTMFFSQITNRNKMKKNKEFNNAIVNKSSFGKAILLKNFKEKLQIY